jgi:hypothetical protein
MRSSGPRALVAATVLSLAVVAGAACNAGSSRGQPADGGADALDSTSGGGEDGGQDAETGSPATGDDAAPTPNATVYLVNAVVDPLAPPTFRFCFGVPHLLDGGPVSVVGAYDPLPDTQLVPYAPAGLPAGTGGSLSADTQLRSTRLASLRLEVYALRGDSAITASDTADAGPDGGAEAPCEYLIGSDALGATTTGDPMPYKGVLTLDEDYFYVGEIVAGELASGTSWVAALEGCVPGETTTKDTALCGGTAYSAPHGTLALQLIQLDSTTKLDGGSLGAQFGQISVAWAAPLSELTAGGSPPPTAAGFYVPAALADAGSPITQLAPIETTAALGQLLPATLAPVSGLTFDGGSGFYAVGWSDAGPVSGPPDEQDGGPCTPGSGNPLTDCVSPWLMSLPEIDVLSSPTAPGQLANGAGYVFLLVGSPAVDTYVDVSDNPPTACVPGPTAPTCVFNTRFVHFLAFPTQ